jgi:hypothetical protein
MLYMLALQILLTLYQKEKYGLGTIDNAVGE